MCMNEKESADGHIQTTFKAIALDIQRVDAQAKSVGKHCSANERKHTENKRTEKKNREPSEAGLVLLFDDCPLILMKTLK